MRLSSIEVIFVKSLFQVSVLSRVGGGGVWVGWVESIIRLISADAEAEALLGLAELGNNRNRGTLGSINCLNIILPALFTPLFTTD